MTLRLRRKHRITVSNLRRAATATDGSKRRAVFRAWWLAPALIGGAIVGMPTSGLAQAEPAALNVQDAQDARPLWSPSRPDAQPGSSNASSSSTLRLVREGWGQSRPETITSGNPSGLRWRGRTAEDVRVPVDDSTIPLTPANWQGVMDLPSNPSVQTVAHHHDDDAFQDPFGDRLARKNDPPPLPALPSSDDAPSSLLPMLDELLPPLDEEQRAGASSESSGGSALPDWDQLPAGPGATESRPGNPGGQPQDDNRPMLSQPRGPSEPVRPQGTTPRTTPAWSNDPPPPLAAPAPSVDSPAPLRSDAFADDERRRIYNDRDCEREDEKCQAARLALRQNPIQNISLDITASFKPDARTAAEEREAAENQLRRMPGRVWRDRQGNVLADGRVVDIRNRRIVVRQEDGSRQTIPLGQLGEDENCFLAAWWQVPTECSLGDEPFRPRDWEPVDFMWTASALYHKPLYFEERRLERYGHTTGPFTEPVLSGAHFFLNVAVLPYKMGMNPPNESLYPLGYYRPGSCAPRLLPPVPISPRGALWQAGVVTGSVFLLP